MIPSLEELKQQIVPVAEKHKLRAVYIFGSYARNEAQEESDVDILIDREGSAIRSLFHMGTLYNDLCEATGKEVDLLTTHALEEDADQDRTPQFTKAVMAERVKIYEQL